MSQNLNAKCEKNSEICKESRKLSKMTLTGPSVSGYSSLRPPNSETEEGDSSHYDNDSYMEGLTAALEEGSRPR